MKSLMRCLNLTIVFLMAFWGVAVANEWYESMESSGIDQSQSALKNISTNGSYAGHQDVQQAVTDIVDSVNRDKTDRDVSYLSEDRGADNSKQIGQHESVQSVALQTTSLKKLS